MTTVYEIDDLQFLYNGETILCIDHLAIRENRLVALVGPNGCGKSTLLNLLAFLLEPATGTIRFYGKEITGMNRHETSRRIGYVQQNPYLFNTTVFENIELGLKLRGTGRALRRARTGNIIEQLGMNDLADKRAHELSGGETQKVALARSLVLEPEVILMDEPFTYLDKAFSDGLEQLLLSIRENRSQTILFSSHDQARAQLIADRICTFRNSGICEETAINIFHGSNRDNSQEFDTGKLIINLGDISSPTHTIAVEPDQVVISRNAIESSMRNQYAGRITGINDMKDHIIVIVDANERFNINITHEACSEMQLSVGDQVWISFKSSAIKVLR